MRTITSEDIENGLLEDETFKPEAGQRWEIAPGAYAVLPELSYELELVYEDLIDNGTADYESIQALCRLEGADEWPEPKVIPWNRPKIIIGAFFYTLGSRAMRLGQWYSRARPTSTTPTSNGISGSSNGQGTGLAANATAAPTAKTGSPSLKT